MFQVCNRACDKECGDICAPRPSLNARVFRTASVVFIEPSPRSCSGLDSSCQYQGRAPTLWWKPAHCDCSDTEDLPWRGTVCELRSAILAGPSRSVPEKMSRVLEARFPPAEKSSALPYANLWDRLNPFTPAREVIVGDRRKCSGAWLRCRMWQNPNAELREALLSHSADARSTDERFAAPLIVGCCGGRSRATAAPSG